LSYRHHREDARVAATSLAAVLLCATSTAWEARAVGDVDQLTAGIDHLVVSSGPIPYERIALFKDPDLEHALCQEGIEPMTTAYRLIEIQVSAVDAAETMPWPRLGTQLANEIRAGLEVPPIVVKRGATKWVLLDGVNRTNAYVAAGRRTIRAYELISRGTTASDEKRQ
jgi:hypothetical protein